MILGRQGRAIHLGNKINLPHSFICENVDWGALRAWERCILMMHIYIYIYIYLVLFLTNVYIPSVTRPDLGNVSLIMMLEFN